MPLGPQNDDENLEDPVPQFPLSNRLERMSVNVREAESNGNLNGATLEQLQQYLNAFESQLNAKDLAAHWHVSNTSTNGDPECSQGDDDQVHLQEVIRHLADTVAAMRLRQQEHRHLHRLSLSRLEDVAKKCLVQEKQIQHLMGSIQSLRIENDTLMRDNDAFRNKASHLEGEAKCRETDVDAMAGAVAGLEGWWEGTQQSAQQSAQSRLIMEVETTPLQQVIRGRGRFRGTYNVKDLDGSDVDRPPGEASEVKDFHDGVRAWLRGSSDLEEEVRSFTRRSDASNEFTDRPQRVLDV